ncbi:pyridoxine 5'-phosphate synthase [Reichenbachiella carrageenanivorans]|uniref:Pyridoxine 5'-phosphate synthase n=1 Tax=Reichenbachiella carrageenanivorans TaxID=2979869 RepID=A0ABY6D1Z5_9BACT|nr:pyridoxine 5'-phosphate synthase [Reichenbachiella carrageenanivorans]UXX80191.1 pyridoxine 5'-phosphate synthase [Reichenbachiella carrageenanivorans]
MTKLSVNVNKFATIRNARGGNNPDLVKVVKDCEKFGAQGITIHPRPDQRHITTEDVYQLKEVVTTEYNIEGYPDERYLKLIEEVKPTQATLVPDPPEAITSNAGWDTLTHASFLQETIGRIKAAGVRVSIFVDPLAEQIEGAAKLRSDRIELYTEAYATGYLKDKEAAVKAYANTAKLAKDLGLGVNAGHDLDLINLGFLQEQIPFMDEVSIGHALVCDALYYGLENTIEMYRRELK